VTAESADFLYKCSDYYAPQHEVAIRWDDPDIGIAWPLAGARPPTVSAKDQSALSFAAAPKFP
jgi:dTDP-4-dehydrorhamnose 3,5-epimerase